MSLDTKILLKIATDITENITSHVARFSQKNIIGTLTGKTGKGGDKTKLGDSTVEKKVRQMIPLLLRQYHVVQCLVVSEEEGMQMFKSNISNSFDDRSGIFLIIDPIDGSHNMRPHVTPKPFVGFSIAIGVLDDLFSNGSFESIRVGIVQDIFYGDTYCAVKEGGAFLNGIRISSSHVTALKDVVLGMSLDHMGIELDDMLFHGQLELLRQTKCQRRIGSSTLDLCRVATGDYDAYVSLGGGLKVHDIAAAQLIIRESGGMLELYQDTEKKNDKILKTLYDGGGDAIQDIRFKIIAAGNEELFLHIREIIDV